MKGKQVMVWLGWASVLALCLGLILLLTRRSAPDPMLLLRMEAHKHQLLSAAKHHPEDLTLLHEHAQAWGDLLRDAKTLPPQTSKIQGDLAQAVDYRHEQATQLARAQADLHDIQTRWAHGRDELLADLNTPATLPLRDLVQAPVTEQTPADLALASRNLKIPRRTRRGSPDMAQINVHLRSLAQQAAHLITLRHEVARTAQALGHQPDAVELAVERLDKLHNQGLDILLIQQQRERTLGWAIAATLLAMLVLMLRHTRRLTFRTRKKYQEQSNTLATLQQEHEAIQLTQQELRRDLQQGLCEFRLDGLMVGTRSVLTETWWGDPGPSCDMMSWLRGMDEDFAHHMAQALDHWDQHEQPLHELPTMMHHGRKRWRWQYQSLQPDPQQPPTVLAHIIDESTLLQREQAAGQAERLKLILNSLRNDHDGFLLWWDRASALINTLASPGLPDPLIQRQQLYELEGELRWGGLTEMAEQCRRLATQIQGEDRYLLRHEGQALQESWQHWGRWLEDSQARRQDILPLSREALQTLQQELRQGATTTHALRTLSAWTRQPVKAGLERLASRAETMAKHRACDFTVKINADTSRVDPLRWAPIWSNLLHLIRNAMDHGIETPAERRDAGKPTQGTITLSCERVQDRFLLSVHDDGRGVDWTAIAEHARRMTLPHSNQEELTRALFHRGLSTSAERKIKGLGMGMACAKQACTALGGLMHVHTNTGKGTTVVLSFPLHEVKTLEIPALHKPTPTKPHLPQHILQNTRRPEPHTMDMAVLVKRRMMFDEES